MRLFILCTALIAQVVIAAEQTPNAQATKPEAQAKPDAQATGAQTPAPAGQNQAAPAQATTPPADAKPATTDAAQDATKTQAAVAPLPPQTADEAFVTKVKSLEEQVGDLKEKIYRTKARLLLLQETVLGGDLSSGARAIIYHRNEMGVTYKLESVSYTLDGASIYSKVDNKGDLAKAKEIEIFSGRIVSGNHNVVVRMNYSGSGFGIFSYLDGYKFNLQSNQTFATEPGKVTVVKVVGYERGGFTTDVKDRPAIRFDIAASQDDTKPPAPQNTAARPK